MFVVFLSALTGFFQALLGVGYRIGSAGNVFPLQTVSAISIVGIIIFAFAGRAEWQYAPISAYVIGVLLGISQYAAIRLMRIALQLGPLSPLWCAVMLSFIPVIAFSFFFLGETVTWWQIAAAITAVATVIAASKSGESPSENNSGTQVTTPATSVLAGGLVNQQNLIKVLNSPRLRYGILLILIMLASSVSSGSLKAAGSYTSLKGGTLSDDCGNLLTLFLYVFLVLPAIVDLTISRAWKWQTPYFYWGALVGTIGSVGGLLVQVTLMTEPAGIVFPVISAASILFAALISTLAFQEKRTKSWYLTLFLSILTIILCNMENIMQTIADSPEPTVKVISSEKQLETQ